MMLVRVHRPTVRGRLRADRGLLVLTGLVVALASALLAAVWPLTVRTADKAVAETVREAGPGASVVATLPQLPFRGASRRDPDALARFAKDVENTRAAIPDPLGSVLLPSVASLSSPPLTVSGPGPSRYLRLVYAQSPTEPPAVTWVAGGAPQSSAGPGEESIVVTEGDPPWPVQVGLSERAALALNLLPGAQLTVADQYGTEIDVRISGIYSPDDPDDPAWRVARELLSPAVGSSDGVERTSVAALVSPEALPDLRIAVPSDEMTQRIAFLPEPERLRWEQAPELRRDVVGLKAAPGLTSGEVGWDSVLDRTLDDATAQVSTARGPGPGAGGRVARHGGADPGARRAPSRTSRARSAHARARAGRDAAERRRRARRWSRCWSRWPARPSGSRSPRPWSGRPVGAGCCPWSWWPRWPPRCWARSRPAGPPASGGCRPTARLGVARNGGGRCAVSRSRRRWSGWPASRSSLCGSAARSPATSPRPARATWWALVGALVLVRVLPPLVRLVLRMARRSAGRLRFFVAARVAAGGLRALPLVVVVVAVTQLVFGTALAATEQRGQESGALLAVGGDARLKTAPAREVSDRAAAVGEAPGVRAAVAGRVADRTLASSVSTGASVRLVVVDARAYERLLAASDLPDAPQLERLTATGGEDAPVPALLLGGPSGLANGLHVRWGQDDVALDVVGEAPRVDATTDPVVVVDAAAFATAGAVADPDTIWAVGPGAPEALRSAAEEDLADTVLTYDEVLTTLRDAPLRAALVHLAVAGSLLLVLLAGLGVVLGAAVDAPARATALGRLRSLGLADRELRRVLAGELLAPVLAGVLDRPRGRRRHRLGDLRLARARGGDGSEREPAARRTAVDVAGRPRAPADGAGAGCAPEQPAPAHQPGAAAAHRRLPLTAPGRQRPTQVAQRGAARRPPR